jgi:hypothetical protein
MFIIQLSVKGGKKTMSDATITKLIDEFNLLPLDDKEFAAEIIRKQLIEAKRSAIAKRVKEVQANLKKGMVKRGTVKELYKDLESD